MLNKLKKSQGEGFTIIEVMIVLAIAGLILLIVFLAVPALQRSSRNTQRKNDASAIASAVANYINDNGGSVPGGAGSSGSNVLICATTACTGNTESAKVGYYVPANVKFVSASSLPAVGNAENVDIVKGYTCNANENGLGNVNSRSAAIIYWTETGSGNPPEQCVEQ